MKLLVCTTYYLWGHHRAIEPQFYYLYKVPLSMGYQADFFDYLTSLKIGVEHMRRQFLTLLKGGGYDAVFIATYRDEFDRETLAEARRYCPVIAWNSDDEWRWDDYSRERVDWYSYMVTNSPDVFEANRAQCANLLHAQWACTGFWDGRGRTKDIDFSFAGSFTKPRLEQARFLRQAAGLLAYGQGSGPLWADPDTTPLKKQWRRRIQSAILSRTAPAFFTQWTMLDFEEVNNIWNRTRVSFTPCQDGTGNTYQIKSRVFDMGLSGSLMIAPRAARIGRYYEAGKEFVEYEDIKDCAEKVKFYLSHENARRQIALAYGDRTLRDHLWRHRVEHVLDAAGLSKEHAPIA